MCWIRCAISSNNSATNGVHCNAVLEADAASRESIVALEVACRNNRCAAFLKLSKWQVRDNERGQERRVEGIGKE